MDIDLQLKTIKNKDLSVFLKKFHFVYQFGIRVELGFTVDEAADAIYNNINELIKDKQLKEDIKLNILSMECDDNFNGVNNVFLEQLNWEFRNIPVKACQQNSSLKKENEDMKVSKISSNNDNTNKMVMKNISAQNNKLKNLSKDEIIEAHISEKPIFKSDGQSNSNLNNFKPDKSKFLDFKMEEQKNSSLSFQGNNEINLKFNKHENTGNFYYDRSSKLLFPQAELTSNKSNSYNIENLLNTSKSKNNIYDNPFVKNMTGFVTDDLRRYVFKIIGEAVLRLEFKQITFNDVWKIITKKDEKKLNSEEELKQVIVDLDNQGKIFYSSTNNEITWI